jgi:hypothetical protein
MKVDKARNAASMQDNTDIFISLGFRFDRIAYFSLNNVYGEQDQHIP